MIMFICLLDMRKFQKLRLIKLSRICTATLPFFCRLYDTKNVNYNAP
jgi:hypothetical protein